MIVRNTSTGDQFFMGPKARSVLSADALSMTEDLRQGGRDTGHMVVTSDDALLLLDPNLVQARSYGLDAPAVVMRVNSTDPESGEWFFHHEQFIAHYMLDEDNQALLPRFARQREEARGVARRIADRLREGAQPIEVAGEIVAAAPERALGSDRSDD
ncbi:hypothetical protein [Demequina sp.]|uniref:hypothetical protein n=1 Tax=Demequina sp. TaxID=2050685 RepID=UPI003A836AF3